jgi:arylsulfatase A-like enzyme
VPGSQPAVIDEAVTLVDIVPSVLEWTGLTIPAGLAGLPLPTSALASRPVRSLVATFGDWLANRPVDPPKWIAKAIERAEAARDSACGPDDHVRGDMVALIRDPYKMIWFQHYPAELYDLRADPQERVNLTATAPQTLSAMKEALAERTRNTGAPPSRACEPKSLPPGAGEALKGLGYIE